MSSQVKSRRWAVGLGQSAKAMVLVAVLAGYGCLGVNAPQVEAPKLDAAEALLVEAALRAETALTRLGKLEGNPAGGGEIPRIVPSALLRRVDFDWIGPLDGAARQLAGTAGYGFEMAGARPVKPVMVRVNAKNRPLIMIFRDVGLQAGSIAAVTVDAVRSLVVLDWTGAGK